MIWADALFWRGFIAWHISTDHRWDMRLHLEAMNGYVNEMATVIGYVNEMATVIGEALLPVVQRTAAALKAMLA